MLCKKKAVFILMATFLIVQGICFHHSVSYAEDRPDVKGFVVNGAAYTVLDTTSGSAISFDDVEWAKNVDKADDLMESIAYGNGIYVAAGRDGCIKTSSDGLAWTKRVSGVHTSLTAVACGGGRFVAVGKDGVIIASEDGVNWVNINPDTTTSFMSVNWNGSRFIAAGDGPDVCISTDGVRWTVAGTNQIDSPRSVIWNGNAYFAAGSDGILTSQDGAVWTKCFDAPYGLNYGFMVSIAWGNGKYVAVDYYGHAYRSSDGIDWDESALEGIFIVKNILWADGQFIVFDMLGNIFTSADGTSWVENSRHNQGIENMAALNGKYLAANMTGGFDMSDDLIHWTGATQHRNLYKSVIWDGQRYLAAYQDGIISSEDGLTWIDSYSAASLNLNSIAYNGERYIAVGDVNTMITSTDGVHWFHTSSGLTGDMRFARLDKILWNGSQFIIVGQSGLILTSADGITWYLKESGTNLEIGDVVWNGGGYIAVTGGLADIGAGQVLASPDGQAWSAVYSCTSGNLSSIAWNGQKYVAGGIRFVGLLTSNDGLNWDVELPGPYFTPAKISWDGIEFIMLTYSGDIWTSRDGIAWVDKGPITSEMLFDIAWNDHRFVAVGDYGTILTGGAPVGDISLGRPVATVTSGGSLQLTAHVSPDNAANKNLSWTSSNNAVAMVFGNGTVRGISKGTATIRAASQSNPAKFAECAVTVEERGTNPPPPPTPPGPQAPIVVPPMDSGSAPEKGAMAVTAVITNDVAKAEITYIEFKNLMDSATAVNGVKKVTINVKGNASKGYDTFLNPVAFINLVKEADITINTPIGRITLPSNMFDPSVVQGAQNIGFSLHSLDRSALPLSVREAIGDAPVMEINATVNGTVKAWSNPDAPVTVTIPYTLKDGENPDNITAYYIDGSGSLVNMQGIYDPDAKSVTFKTSHFSNYIAKANEVSFADLTGYESYERYIRSMAAKGIITGVGDSRYAPGKALTRAEFSTLLVKMLQLEVIDTASAFKDVDAFKWYAPYINAAYKAGLIKGVTASTFAPDAVITNQDAAVILVKALKYRGEDIASGSLAGIRDSGEISSYAAEAVGFTVLKGITPTDAQGDFHAKNAVNRASAAEYIYRVFNFKPD